MHILIQPKSSLTGENGLKWESFIGRLERDKFSFSQQLRKSHNLLSCFVFESYCKKDKRNIFNVEKSSEDHVSCRAGPRQNSFAELEKVKNRSTFQFVCILFVLPCTYVQFQHSTNCVAPLCKDRDGDDDVDVDGHDAEGFFYINSSVLLNINMNTFISRKITVRKYKPEGIPQDCWSLQGQGFHREEQLPRTQGSARRGLSSKSRWR